MTPAERFRHERMAQGIELTQLINFRENILTFDYPIWANDFSLFYFIATQYAKTCGHTEHTDAVMGVLSQHKAHLEESFKYMSQDIEARGNRETPVLRHYLTKVLSSPKGEQGKQIVSVFSVKMHDGSAAYPYLPYLAMQNNDDNTAWDKIWRGVPNLKNSESPELLASL